MLLEIDEDIARFADEYKVIVNRLKVDIRISSTFEPCNVCKRDVIIRKKVYQGNIEVYRPFYFSELGTKEIVKGSSEFETYLKQDK